MLHSHQNINLALKNGKKKNELNLIKHKDNANIQATNLASTKFFPIVEQQPLLQFPTKQKAQGPQQQQKN